MIAKVPREKFLDLYSDYVETGTDRIPYASWRIIKKASDELKIKYINDAAHSLIHITNSKDEFLYSCDKESSIGKALYNIMLQFASNDLNIGQTLFDTINGQLYCCTDNKGTLYKVSDNTITGSYLNNPIGGYGNTVATTDSINFEKFNKAIEALKEETLKKERKEKEMNTSNFIKFDFGPVSSSRYRMSPYGIAVCTSNNDWVSYNKDTNEIVDVDVLNFDASKFLYKMPVAQKDVAIGDIVVHANKPVFVRAINDNGTIEVVDYVEASVSNILPVKSPFGFNFFTKIVSLVDFSKLGADSDNPFGNMLPFMLMGDGAEFNPLMFMMMNGKMDMSNPMMMYALMSGQSNKKNTDNDGSWLLPMIMVLMNSNAPAAK